MKHQIKERAEYEAAVFETFKKNPSGQFVYVVENNNDEPYGFFADFDAAVKYAAKAIKSFEEYDCTFQIQKYTIVSKNNLGEKCCSSYFARATIWYNKSGEMCSAFSSEIPSGDPGGQKGRFEDMYFKIPFGMDYGIVKDVTDNTYGVLGTNKEHWDQFMGKWSDDALEFGDIQVMVFKLLDDGIWSHRHINPLHLEPETPENTNNDEMQAAFITAAKALVEYFKNETEQTGKAVIDTAKAYSEVCHRLDCEYLMKASTASDIIE